MKLLSNMKVATKLLLLVIPVFATMVGLVIYFSGETNRVKDNSQQALYDEAFVSTSLVLNADRDFYQAVLAESEIYYNISMGMDAEKKDALLADYEENISQVFERISSAMENVSGNAQLYTDYPHEGSGITLQQLGDSLIAGIAEWKKLYDAETETGDFDAKMAAFAVEREKINQMTEILESYANFHSDEIAQSVQSSLSFSVIVSAVIILILSGLAVRVIVLIRGGIRHVTHVCRRISQGDLDVKIDSKRQTKDEIGQLTQTIDKDIRQAFKDIKQAGIITEKQSEYQARQVDKLVDNLERLAAGELNCDMAVSEADEDTQGLYKLFSAISNNLHDSVDSIKSYIDEISYVLDEMSKGNMVVEITTEYKGSFVQLKQSINKIAMSLNKVLTEINDSAEQVAMGTRQVSDGSQEISRGATEQASSIEELSASVTQIAEQIKHNAENAKKSNEVAAGAKAAADESNEKMKGMLTSMTEINESSTNISKIIKVIDDIAFQTNILALNAAVEAARAGVHGKGFAVVAEEVRNLVGKSAQAAKETTELIEGSIDKVEAGTRIANDTAQALASIVTGAQEAVSLSQSISSSSSEQASGITQINNGIEQLSRVVQTNSATAQQSAAASEELSSQTEVLKNMVGQFNLKPRGRVDSTAEESVNGSVDKEVKRSKIVLDDDEFGKY